MAVIVLDNPAYPGVIYQTQYTSVWAKPYWGAEWQFVSYLFPQNSSERAAPADSEATYTWDFGTFLKLPGTLFGGTLFPINIENWLIQTRVHTTYGTYISWLGVVVGETMKESGIDTATGVPRGHQVIECRGPEYLLERRNVIGTFYGNESDSKYLPVTRDFNVSGISEDLVGNRSASRNYLSNSYLFGSENNKWSNLDIIEYLLAAFQPWYPYEAQRGSVEYVPLFYVVGQTDALDSIYEEHRFHGTTVRDALNKLIDRQRGFGWRIETDGVGPIYIVVFSLSQYSITGANAYIPANPRQLDVQIHDDKFIEATYRISSTAQVDEIIVESDTPIKTVATPAFDLGSLEEAWDSRLDENLPDEDSIVAIPRVGQSDLLVDITVVAQDIIDNWESIGDSPQSADRKTFYQFNQYTSLPLEVYNILDTNGDSWLTLDDLSAHIPPTSYQSASEDERASDKYAAVYSHYQVPKDWNWEGWVPFVDDFGYVRLDLQGAYANSNHSFERVLPFKEDGIATDSEREYLEPFAVIAKPSRLRDVILALAEDGNAPYDFDAAQSVDSTITQSEFDQLANEFDLIDWPELEAEFANNPYRYIQLDKAEQLAYPAMSMRMSDSGMKIVLTSKANHVFAAGHWDGSGSDIAPIFNYETLLPTVMFETDEILRVKLRVWTNSYQDSDGNTVGQSTPTGKQIFIQARGKECWIAAPWTVKELNEGELVFYSDGEMKIIRDDSDDLRFIALVAYLWYGQQRASAEFRIQNQLRFFALGDLIRSSISGFWSERIGTTVTSIDRDYQEGTHVVTTGYGELDPGAFEDSES